MDEWLEGETLLGNNKVGRGLRLKAMKNKLLPHPSVLYQSWNEGAEGLGFVLRSETGPVHPHFPTTKKETNETIMSQRTKVRHKTWETKGRSDPRPPLTCAVTTLSPLVALARSKECCSSLVRLLTVLLGDNRPEGSRASQLTGQTTDSGQSHNRAENVSVEVIFHSHQRFRTEFFTKVSKPQI